MESPAGDLPEFGGQVEVMVGGNGRDVTEIGSQMRQLGAGIVASVVTVAEGGYRHAMAEVMQGGGTPAGIDKYRR